MHDPSVYLLGGFEMYVTMPENFSATTSAVRVDAPLPIADTTRAHRRVKTGHTLFHEGEDAQHLYEVVTGVVRLSRVTIGGRRQVIAFGFPGDILGFPANGQYHTDCDVLEPGEIAVYSSRILDACSDNPALHRYLVRAAMSEISGMQDHFMVLGRKCASERTAAFLSVLTTRIGKPGADGTLIRLPMFRSDIADFLGLSSETISRTFTHLRDLGIIELITSRELLVRDVKALADLSEEE